MALAYRALERTMDGKPVSPAIDRLGPE